MGSIIKTLSAAKASQDSLYSKCVRCESAEVIHFHWRNFRILMTDKQFETFALCVKNGNSSWNRIQKEKGEGDGILLSEAFLLEDQLDADKMCVELNEARPGVPQSVHVHYKDMRFEMPVEEFVKYAECVKSGLEKLKSLQNASIF